MASGTRQGPNLLYGVQKYKIFESEYTSRLPAAYQKFWKEWKGQAKAKPVHYIPKQGSWERDPVTGVVNPVQNVPIPVLYPPESNQGIWGGEGVVKGFQKRSPYKKRVPHFWTPVLRRTVLHSVVLNKYWSIDVTDRAMDLIHECQGFDHYLLKTPACDLKSTLAFRIKRNILQALQDKCPDLDLEAKSTILEEYSKYLEQYTPEEIEWYGYTFREAILKANIQFDESQVIVPQKVEFRSRLIQQLREAGIAEAQEIASEGGASEIGEKSTWLSKMNPFGKKQET